MPTMSDERIGELNRQMRAILDQSQGDMTGAEAYDASMIVVQANGLILVDDSREQTRTYRDALGAAVNLWIEGDALGFDDQIQEPADIDA